MGISRIPQIVPRNKYSLSDIFEEGVPLTLKDPDAYISQDLEGEPWIHHAREFDILGRQGCVRHLVRLVVTLHDEHSYLRERQNYTGVFVNHQETGRLEDGQNGHDFYVAETDNNVRIVSSPVSDLDIINHRIISLHRLPNENHLFNPDDQFRSRHTPNLLARDREHARDLVDADLKDIRSDPLWGVFRLFFRDRYGNLLFSNESGIEEERELLRSHEGKSIGICVGDQPEREAYVTSSLQRARRGVLNVYPNQHNIDVLYKWEEGYNPEKTAYRLLGLPVENITNFSLRS